MKRNTKAKIALFSLTLCFIICSINCFAIADEPIVLRYAHMNPPTSVAGQQASILAKLVEEKTGGKIKIQVYPASQLGTIQEQAEMVSAGIVAIHHNTMAGIGSLYEDFAALDTPYLYKDVAHLMRVTNPWTSPLMKNLNQKLIKARGVRIFYTFYFGTRHLTCDRPVYSPDDLKGVKIRSIPFPIYTATVEGMGAIATPIDFAEVPTALATGAVNGQENPADTILSAKLYEIQSHLVLTGHIMGAECVVINDKVWNKLPSSIRRKLDEAAKEMYVKASKMTEELEAMQIAELKAKGMTVIGPENGLNLEAFKVKVKTAIANRFEKQYSYLYEMIGKIK